ncbi:polycystin-1-like [Haliotis asinina]|uniref:polycystin-1-like n=1 Tax=Haliotis asinina TaxID=109174 RepID=UPI00353245AF
MAPILLLFLFGRASTIQNSLTASFTMSNDPSCINMMSTSNTSALQCIRSTGNCDQWIQVSVMEPILFTEVRLSAYGLDTDPLQAFRISYSDNALTWKYLKDKTLKKKTNKGKRGKSGAVASAVPAHTIPYNFTAKHLRVDLQVEGKRKRICLHFSILEQDAVPVLPVSVVETYLFTAIYLPPLVNTDNTGNQHTREPAHDSKIGRHMLQVSELSLDLSCTTGCGGELGESVTLTVTCSNCDGLGSVSYMWDIQIVLLENLPREVWEDQAAFASSDTTLTLPGRFFNPFQSYVFTVSGTVSGTEGTASYTIPEREHTLFITTNINATSVSVDSQVAFLVLLKDSDSSVLINIGGYDQCTPHFNTVSRSTRRTYPLSMFLLSKSTKGIKYAVFDTQFHTNGNFIISASTVDSPSISSQVSVSVVYENEQVGVCTNGTVISNTSRALQTAKTWSYSLDINLQTTGHTGCPSVTENHSWFIQNFKSYDLSMCTSEADFAAVDLNGVSLHNPVFSIMSGYILEGYYKVCLASEICNNSVLLGKRTVCGFIQVQEDEVYPHSSEGIQPTISCSHGCPHDCMESVTLTANCPDCLGYTWEISKHGSGLLPGQVWENWAVFNTDNSTLTLPSNFFNPFESYNIQVKRPGCNSDLSSQFLACFLIPEDKMYLTSNSNSSSVPVDSYVTFLLLVNDSISSSSVDISGQDSCNPVLQTLTPSARSSYPLSTFLLSPSTEGLKYALFGRHLGRDGNLIINASTSSPTPSLSITSLDVVYEKMEIGQCTNDTIVNGTSRSIQGAPVYFRSRDLYLSLTSTVSCVLTSQNYNWTVKSYKQGDTSMCYREEDFEDVTLVVGSLTSAILHISAGALSQGFYRIGVTFEKHDSHSSVGTRTLYGFLQVVNEPLIVVMSPSVTHLIHDRNLPLVLNASSSYNPNVGLHITMSFSWHCQMDGQPCDCVPRVWPGVGNDTEVIPHTDPVLRIEGRYLTVGQNYSFTMTLDSDNVTGSNYTVLVTATGVVSLQLEINYSSMGVSTESVTLAVTCSNCEGLGSINNTWGIHKGQVGLLPPQIWEGHAVLNSDKTSLTLPGYFFNPFEVYNISVTDPATAKTPEKASQMESANKEIMKISEYNPDAITSRRGVKRKRINNHYSPETRAKIAKYAVDHVMAKSSAEGSAFHVIPAREDKMYLTSNSNSSSVPVDSYVTFLLLVNDSISSSSVDISGQDSCNPVLQTLTPSARSSYPLSTFLLSPSTEGLKYALFGRHLGRDGNLIINASTSSPTPSLSITSLDVVYEKMEIGQCTNDTIVNGTSRSIQGAPVYFRSRDLYLSLTSTVSCVLTSQNYNWTVKSYRQGDTSMCYREEDFEDVTLVVGSLTSAVLHISAGALSQGFYRIGVTFEKHDSHSSVGTRTLYGFLQVVNEPLIVVMSPSVTHVIHDSNLPLVLNASSSYNPNVGLHTTVRFSWHCQMDGQSCDCVPKVWPGVGNDTEIIPHTDPVLRIEGRYLTVGQNYSFTVTLDSDNVTSSNYTVLVMATGVVSLHFNIRCISGCGGTFSPSKMVSLKVSCSNCYGTVKYSWRVERNGREVLPVTSLAPQAVVGIDGSLTVPAHSLLPWDTYNFIVRGTINPTGEANFSISFDDVHVFLMSTEIYVTAMNPLLFLVQGSSSAEDVIQLTINNKYMCTSNLSEITPTKRATYPLSSFFLTEETDNMGYQVISHQFNKPGMYDITASTNVSDETFSSTVTIIVLNTGGCAMSVEILGTGESLLTAREYSMSKEMHFTSTYSSECEEVTALSYNWTVSKDLIGDPNRCRFEDDFQKVALPDTSGVSLHITSKILPRGYNRLCVMIVFSIISTEFQSRQCGYLKMLAEPLVASLSPSASFLTLPRNHPLVLNANTSYNPNSLDQSNMSFSWSCTQNGGLCDFYNTVWPGGRAASTLPVSEAVLTIPSDLLTLGQTYKLTMELTKFGLEGSAANISVLITNPTTPSIIVRCKLGCGLKLNPSENLALEVVCLNCDDIGLPIQTYEWSVTSTSTNLPMDAAQLAAATTTGIHQSAFVLSAYFLDASDMYDITVTVTNSQSEEGSTVYTVITNSPPVPGSCTIFPQSGQALVTHFTVTCSNFHDKDTPLLYKMYLQNLAGENDKLLYYGQTSSTSHMTFSAGPESSNYTHTISILVFDSYNTSTFVTVSVQVLHLEAGNSTVSEILHDMVQNFTVTLGDQEGNQGILRLAENIATSLNDETSDTAEESKAKRLETREILLTKLSDVEIQSQDSIEQMTDVIGELTITTEEVTDTMQEQAVSVSARLTASLGDVAESAPTAAKVIAKKQLLILENLIELSVHSVTETMPPPGSGTSSPPTSNTVEEKTKPILDVYEKIGDAMLRGIQFAKEEPLHIESEKMSLALGWTEADDDSDMELAAKLQDQGKGGQLRIPIKSSLQNSSTNSTGVEAVNVQVQVMSSNPYVWDDSAEGINFPVVNVIMKSRGIDGRKIVLEDLVKPADIIITDNIAVSRQSWAYQELNVTISSNTIISSDSKAIKIYSNSSLMVRLTSMNTSLTLKVFVKANNVISSNEILESGFDMPLPSKMLLRSGNRTQDPNLVFLPKMEASDSYYTVGFTIKPGQNLSTEGLQNETSVNVSVETYSVTCSYWDEGLEIWSTRGCLVSPFTTLESLHCQCNHLSAFSGGIFVAPNTVNPITDAVLFLQFFDNPVVVSTVIAVWGVYLLLLYWARQKDKDDAKKNSLQIGTTILADNDPRDKYVYLICVVTSWWPQAGTTANIFLYLRARYRQSARHILADPHRKLFTPGAENWFILTTSRRLGKIKSVVVWHDNRGKNPSWYLKEVVVRDIQTKEVWHCLYDDWLAVDRGPGFIQVEIPSLNQSSMDQHRLYRFVLKSSQDFRNSHLWISIFSKPAYNQFTRAQRLTCSLSLLLTTMLSSIMFHGVPTDEPEDQIQSGQITLSLSGIVIGIQSGLMMFPINTILLQFFTRTALKETPSSESSLKERNGNTNKTGKDEVREEDIEIGICNTERETVSQESKLKDLKCCFRRKSSKVVIESESARSKAKRTDTLDSVKAGTDEVDLAMSRGKSNGSTTKSVGTKKKVKKPFSFPWWFLYIAWTLALATCIICSYFVMLYGLKYGYQKSVDFLVSFFTAFSQSAIVTQPVKVVIVAALLTQILKRPVNYDSWTSKEEVEKLKEKVTAQVASQVSDHQRYYTPPLSTRALREIRKRIQLDNRARMILYEICLYFTFVAIVLLMIYGHRNIDMAYRVTHTTENMFTEDTGFSEVTTAESMWEYLQGDFLDNLVSGTDPASPTSCQASYLLGKARLRQLRLKPGTCSYPAIMKKFASIACTGPYSISDEETGHYNTSWSQPVSTTDTPTMYTYRSSFQLVTIPFVGKLATYSGGGYVQELPRFPDSARGVMDDIQSSDWIDQYTRAVFVEFSLYNPNINMISVIILVFEYTNFGGVFPYYQIFTSKLYHYTGGFEQFVAVCEAVFLIYVIIFTYLEIKKYRQMSTSDYFKDTWSYIEVIIIALSYTVFGLFIQRIVTVDYSIKLYKESMGQSFVSFYPAASSDIILQYVMAALSSFVILKFFKLLRFNLRMSILAGSLKRCKSILFQFFIKVFLYTMAFSCFSLLVFATELQEYSNFGESVIALFNFALGASDYFGLESASKTLGPLFFFTFSFLYQFLLISIFISIVMDGYAAMVEHVLSLHTEVHMVEFIWRKIKLHTMTDKKRKNAYQKNLYKIQTRR